MAEVQKDVQYEVKDVQAIRGMEARTIAKWEKDGWELVDRAEGGMLRTKMSFRRPKPKQPWYLWAGAGAVLLVLAVIIGVNAAAEGDTTPANDAAAIPTETAEPVVDDEPEPDPEPEPELEPEPEPEPARTLDATVAAQHLAMAWEDRFVYGGSVHWILDRITSEGDDGTYDFKIGATITNAYGTEYSGTIEGTVGGTDDAPVILDSILYTDAGEIIDYYG